MTGRQQTDTLEAEIEALAGAGDRVDHGRARDAFGRLRAALSAGEVRAAEPDPNAPVLDEPAGAPEAGADDVASGD